MRLQVCGSQWVQGAPVPAVVADVGVLLQPVAVPAQRVPAVDVGATKAPVVGAYLWGRWVIGASVCPAVVAGWGVASAAQVMRGRRVCWAHTPCVVA